LGAGAKGAAVNCAGEGQAAPMIATEGDMDTAGNTALDALAAKVEELGRICAQLSQQNAELRAQVLPLGGVRGDLYADKTGRLWFCKKSGTTATWHQIA
jgi:hypothetical protein